MQKFKTTYWGDTNDTEVLFETADILPPRELVSACMVVATTPDGKVAMSRPKRGWGLVGGHLEPNESIEECVRREALEEAGIELGEISCIGRWRTKKLKETPQNNKYPPLAYQLLFMAPITRVHEYVPTLEIAERAFVDFTDMLSWHHDFDGFEEIFAYIKQIKKPN